jgi:hypothetical protein
MGRPCRSSLSLPRFWRSGISFSYFRRLRWRSNDLTIADTPVWFAAIWLASTFANWLSAYFGLFTDLMTRGLPERALFVVTLGVDVWLLIDLALLRGQRGPNRYGPDPLGAADASATAQPGQWRPTIGETLRDSVVGVTVVIAVLALSGWNFGIPALSSLVIHWLVTPKALTTMLERGGNQPAVKAYQEGRAAVDASNFEDAGWPVCTENSDSDVVVMQSTEEGM